MGFMKNLFRSHHHTDKEANSTATTPISSSQTTPATSPRSSLVNVDATIKPLSKYYQDPMRTSKQPDTVGNFFDPMGGHGGYYSAGNDVTNTGA